MLRDLYQPNAFQTILNYIPKLHMHDITTLNSHHNPTSFSDFNHSSAVEIDIIEGISLKKN